MIQRLLKCRFVLLFFDIAGVILASYAAILVRYGFYYPDVPDYYLNPINRYLAINIALTIMLLLLFGMYKRNREKVSRFGLIHFVAPCFLSSGINIFALHYFRIGGQAIPRSYYILYFFILLAVIALSRLEQFRQALLLFQHTLLAVNGMPVAKKMNKILSDINNMQFIKKASESLSYQHISIRVRAMITKTDKQAFLSALICCFFGYGYFGFHLIPNHDGIMNLNWNTYEAYGNGRWSRTMLSSISDFYTPWLLIIISFLALAISAVIVVRLLEVKRFVAILATSVCLTLSPPVISIMTYAYLIDGHFIGLALGFASAYAIERCKLQWAGLLSGTVLLAISMGEYQMFVCVVIALFSVRLLQILIQNKSSGEVFRFISKYIFLIISATGLYFVMNRVVLSALNLNMSGYIDLDRAAGLSYRDRLDGLAFAYRSIGEHLTFTLKHGGSFAYFITALLFALIPVLAFILLVSVKKRPIYQVALVVLIIAILPVLMNSIFLLSPDPEYVHVVMKYAACFIFICGIVLTEELSNRTVNNNKNIKLLAVSLLTWVMLAGTILVGFRWGVIANEAGTILEVHNRNFTALCIRIVDRIEQYPGFDVQNTAVLIGYSAMVPDNSNYPDTKPFFREYQDFTGLRGFDYIMFTIWEGRVYQYINDYIGFGYINEIYKSDAIKNSEAYQKMPCFPDAESLAMIDGVLVVKLTY